MKLITTKIIPPSVAVGLLERPRLAERLADILRVRVTVVRAPAGYGKTSQMMQWHATLLAHGAAACWISLDHSDRDGVEILSYAAAALESGGVATPGVKALIAEGAVSPEVALAGLIDDLLEAKRPVVVFLDDLHVLKAPATLRTLSLFIGRAPANVHFVLATREAPDLPLARSRVQGSVVEVTADDLRFSEGEMASFMAMNGHGDLDRQTIGALDDCTEGWAAGLRLASLAMTADTDACRMLTTFTGGRRAIADFFAQDVLAHYPAEVQDFLFDTAILERLCPALCDTVTGSGNARNVLDRIEESGLFLFSLDDDRTWYRYHHLFADFLMRRAADSRANRVAELHRRASRWLSENGFDVDAFEHAMKAGDPSLAASLLDRCCLSTFYGGQVRTLLALAERVPAAELTRFPRVTLTKAWSLIIQWNFDEARPLLAAARARVEAMRVDAAVDAAELAELEFLLLHREMMLAQFEDDMPLVERQCHQLMRAAVETDPYVSGTLYTSLIFAERELFRLGNAASHEVKALGHFRRSGSRFVIVWHQSIMGPTRLLAGNTDKAIEALQDGIEAATVIAGPLSPLAAIPSLLRAEVHYERNEIEEADRLCTTYLPLAGELGFIDQLVAGYLTRSRLLRLAGDGGAAATVLDDGLETARAKGFHRLERHLWCERITHLLRDGRNAEALSLVQRHALVAKEPTRPLGVVTTTAEVDAILWVRVALARNHVAQAVAVASQWRAFTDRAGAIRSTIRWDILLAQALTLQGDVPAAQRALRRAVVNATPGRFIRCFLDEGAVIIGLLSQSYGDRPADADGLAATLLLRAPQPDGLHVRSEDFDQEVPREALNPREIEILQLVDSGLLNKEIGLRLGMTEGSVKWYLQQIYDKLGTRRRSVAVQWARQLGLLRGANR